MPDTVHVVPCILLLFRFQVFNMWLDAHATHVVIAVHHIIRDEVVESVNVTLVYPSEMGLR